MGKITVENNIELLKAMDVVVRYLNDEEAIEPWLMYGVPDGADHDDYEDIASDDELMDLACRCFGQVMRRASKDGWFTSYELGVAHIAYGAVKEG